MITNFGTPPGCKRTTGKHGRLVMSNRASGIAVMRPGLAQFWFIFRSDGTKDPQPYSTWIDAVRDAEPRKENDGRPTWDHHGR